MSFVSVTIWISGIQQVAQLHSQPEKQTEVGHDCKYHCLHTLQIPYNFILEKELWMSWLCLQYFNTLSQHQCWMLVLLQYSLLSPYEKRVRVCRQRHQSRLGNYYQGIKATTYQLHCCIGYSYLTHCSFYCSRSTVKYYSYCCYSTYNYHSNWACFASSL